MSLASLRRHWPILSIWLLVIAAYANSFHAGFVFDSGPVILDDPRVHAATSANIHEIFTGDYWYRSSLSGLYRPVTTLSYLLNYAVLGSGPRPAGYHYFNLAIHLVNAALVYALGMVLFDDAILAWGLALLWGVQPLLTEAVTNIVGRADLLMALGVLAGLLCYIRSTRGSPGLWLTAMGIAQAVAIFSKETGVVLPVLVLLYAVLFERAVSRRQAGAAAALAVPMILFFLLRSAIPSHLRIPFFENPLSGADFLAARLTAVKVIGELAWLFVWPARLSADYSYNCVPVFPEGIAATVVSLLVCVAAVALAWWWRQSHRAAAFFIAFFFVAIAPTANIAMLIGSIKAERFFYLGSIGLAGCVIAALGTLKGKIPQKAIAGAIAAACLLLAARTYARNADWQTEQSLWTSAVAVCPNGARPHNNLGNALMKIPGRTSDAVAEFQTALRILPNYADAHYNLGTALSASPEHLGDAIEQFRAALRLDPASAKAHINLGTALAKVPGHAADAVSELRIATKLEPDSVDAHYNLANALAQLAGRIPEAVAEYETALRLDPNSAPAHNNLGSILSAMPGRLPDAIAEYRAALRSDPNYAKAHNNLGNALARVPGQSQDAIAEYQAALKLQPDFADAHYNLGVAYARIPGRRQEAIAEFEAALRLDPNPETQRAIDWLKAAGH